LKDRKLLYC